MADAGEVTTAARRGPALVEVEPRRLPAQARSRRRFDAMLDAFAALLGEMSFDAITTHHVAERAGVPIGTLYQFFPNKFALATALSRRHAEEFGALVEESLAGAAEDVPWYAMFDRLMDGVAGVLFSRVAISRLWAVTQVVPELQAARDQANALSRKTAEAFLRPYFGHLSDEELRMVAETFSRTTYALLFAAAQEEGAARSRILRELKRLIKAYLASYLPPGAEEGAGDGSAARVEH